MFTGAMLLDECQAKGANRVRCEAYVSGVVDAAVTLGQAAGSPVLCVPPTTSTGDIVGTVEDYLRRSDGELNMTASSLSLYALQLKYSCPE